jgi:hypothetical protein
MKYFLALALFIFPLFMEAKRDVTPKCLRHLEESFSDPQVVTKALSLYDVPETQWIPITGDLAKSGKNLHEKLWQKGRKKGLNPLDTKYQPEVAALFLKEVFQEEFRQILKKHFVNNSNNIEAMFSYVEKQQAAKIRACFGRNTFEPKKETKEDSP